MKIACLVVGQQYLFNGIKVTYDGMRRLSGKCRYTFINKDNSFHLSGMDVKHKVSVGGKVI